MKLLRKWWSIIKIRWKIRKKYIPPEIYKPVDLDKFICLDISRPDFNARIVDLE